MINSFFFYKEIKNRCFILLLLWVFNATVCFWNKENILFFLFQSVDVGSGSDPMYINETYFVFTDLPEVFSVFMESTLFFTNQLSTLPFLYQLIVFFSTSFRSGELNTIKRMFESFAAGWVLTFIVFKLAALPSMLLFFLTLPNKYNALSPYPILFEAKLNQFLGFCLSVYVTCLLTVEFCAFSLFLIVSKAWSIKIQKNRKNFYLIVVIMSFLTAPFEVLSQMLLISFILSYWELTVFVRFFYLKGRN